MRDVAAPDGFVPADRAPSRTAPSVVRLAAFLLAVVVVGCTSPRRAEVVVCVEQEPSSLDPRAGSDLASERVFALVHRGLFRAGPDLRPEPDLVESFERPDPLTYRLTLRRGVRFSDGREVTAVDAAFTLESVRRGEVPSARRGDLEGLASVRATGRYGLELVLRDPFAPLLSGLTVGIVPVGTPAGSSPPGCGPYMLARWVRGQWVDFEANPHALPGPRADTLSFKVVPDAVVRSLELRRGGVDLVVNDLPPDALAHFAVSGYEVSRSPGANYRYIGIQCSREPLDRPEVRRALAMAVDREALLRYLQRGFGRPAGGLLCPENWAYAPTPPLPYDPAAAKALLARNGYGPERPLRLTYKTSSDKLARRIATAVQGYLGEVGVELEVRSLEWGTFYADVQRGEFDLFGLVWVGITDPDALRLRFATSAFPPAGLNRGRFSDGEVDLLLQAGATEPDPGRRRELYARAQVLLADGVPSIPLWYPDNVAVAREGLEGVALPPDGTFGFLRNVGWREGRRP